MPDGVLDQRLQNQRGHEQPLGAGRDVGAHLQIVLEAQALDGDVTIRELQFLAQRHAHVAAGLEHDAQQVAERDDCGQGTPVLGQANQRGDGVERVEQEMRLQSARKHVEPCLRELALQLELHQVALGKAAVVHERIADAGHSTVGENVDEQFDVEALTEAALVEMREHVDGQIDAPRPAAHSNSANPRCSASALQALAALVFEQLRGGEDEGREQPPDHHALDGQGDLARREAGDAGTDRDDVARPDDGGNGDPRGSRHDKGSGGQKSAAPRQRSIGREIFIVGHGRHGTILVAMRDGWRSATIRPGNSTVGCTLGRICSSQTARPLRIS